jgi:hypothetical protein
MGKLIEIFKFFMGISSSKKSTPTLPTTPTPQVIEEPTIENPTIEEPTIEDPIATTDISEILEIEKEPISEPQSPEEEFKSFEHFLPTGEYFAGPTKKEWVFWHHTAGWNNPYKTIDDWGKDSRGAVATEYVLGGQKITDNNSEFDGLLVKAFPEGGWGWHLGTGRGKLHSNSVGIELNNFGYLTKGGFHKTVNGKRTWVKKSEDKFYTYVGTEAHPNQVIELEKSFRGHKFWHNYSDEQIGSLRRWSRYIALRDNIDISKGLPELVRTMGAFEAFDFCDVKYVTANPGLWCHTNVQKGKVDLYPHPKVIELLLSF